MRVNLKIRHFLIAACFASGFAGNVHAEYVTPNIHHEPFGEVKVVVPLTSTDQAVWIARLHNISNGMKATSGSGGSLLAKVVLFSGGVKMLLQPVDPKLKEAIDEARAAGVRFNVCNFSLKGMNQDWHELYGVQEADIVPSGFGEVAWLGNHGWAIVSLN